MAREMKDSGADWIGKIPKEWELKKGKNLFEQVSQKGNLRCLQLLSPTQNYGVIPQSLYEEQSGMSAVKLNSNVDLNDLKTVHVGAFCISLRSFQGGFEYSRYEGVVSNAYQIFYGKAGVYDHYYRYLFKDSSFIEKMNSYTMSLRDGKNIAFTDFGNTLIPYPSFEEQQQIANFLDAQCSEIDGVVADIKKEIELLKEYRKSVIYEAVTKGLDPNAELKDSGIEWIGKIPKHWEIVRMKDLGKTKNGLTYKPADMTDESGLLVLRSSNIQDRKLSLIDNVFVKTSVHKDLMLKDGDILICSRNGSKELIGKNILIDKNVKASFGAFMMVFRGSNSPHYVYYLLNSEVFSYYLSSFLTSTINQLTSSNFINMKVPYTFNLKEQYDIVDFLDAKCAEIDVLVSDKQQQIEKLNEYKKSLIYEYVTGKKEVPAV